ncbi:HAUS augmin-like complex subunit 8 [Watersipora subatra]|uniref:HAUS augmin-like complex subunit 8 n=1 Tax=Watersipora subatra TaxID=2589382 RepID=UPI00355C2187
MALRSNFTTYSGSPARKVVQGNLVVTSASQSAVFNPSTKSDSFPNDGVDSSVPHSIKRSVYGFTSEQGKPLSDLDLSDEAQGDITERATAKPKKEEERVIVIDALSQRMSRDAAEVAVTERLELSPHKVICHSPRAAQLSLRDTGDTHRAANVGVDLMPSIAVKSSNPEPNTSQNTASSLSSSGAELGSEVPSSIQDISNELQHLKTVSPKDQPAGTTKDQLTGATKDQPTGATKKTKKSRRVVASRFMNSTTNQAPKKKDVKKRQVSTPKHYAPNESFDVSALQSTRLCNRLLNETESFTAPPPESGIAASQKSLSYTTTKKSQMLHKKNTVGEVTQDSIDVCYSRYLQWLFLSSKVDKAIESEETNVMSELQKLSIENHKMRQKLSALEQELDRLEHVTNLDEMLELQQGLLGPIVSELPQLSQYYQSMAVALDTTRHELHTVGINIPDTEHEQKAFEGAMMAALDESEQLLADVASHTRRDMSTTSQYAQAVESLSKCVSEEEKELRSCKDLVRAAQSLANHENSMKIQDIESSRQVDPLTRQVKLI